MEHQAQILELYAGEILLAILENLGILDWPWHTCDVKPTQVFEQYRHIFEADFDLFTEPRQEPVSVEAYNERQSVRNAAYKEIAELKLTLVIPKLQLRFTTMLFHTDGKMAYIRSMFRASPHSAP